MTLPGENGQNLVEWRFRKEQTRGKVIVFGRKLRVSSRFLRDKDMGCVVRKMSCICEERSASSVSQPASVRKVAMIGCSLFVCHGVLNTLENPAEEKRKT